DVLSGGISIRCFAYEPTKEFRKTLEALIIGDKVKIGAAVRPPSENHPECLNVEYLEILELVEDIIARNPRCPSPCGKRTESLGLGQGFRCPRCRKRLPAHIQKENIRNVRRITLGTHIPPPTAQRHLTFPADRKPQQVLPFIFDFEKFQRLVSEIRK
ncbi:MAG TPA: hypothetical protein VJ044_10045, partial [Candidatus Hodarchaeales archaeon]|nr:hypothetical protein [Candidatus Hodarchaeales archaeon]